jgi:hypothetical protein
VVVYSLSVHFLPVRWTFSALITTTKSPASVVGGEGRPVLAPQHGGDARGRAPEGLSLDVGDEPGVLEGVFA